MSYKRFFAGIVLLAFFVPCVSFAQSTVPTTYSPQYVALLQQLIKLLEQELVAIQPTPPSTTATTTAQTVSSTTSTTQIASSTSVTASACDQHYTLSQGMEFIAGHYTQVCMPDQSAPSGTAPYFVNQMGFQCSVSNPEDCSFSE